MSSLRSLGVVLGAVLIVVGLIIIAYANNQIWMEPPPFSSVLIYIVIPSVVGTAFVTIGAVILLFSRAKKTP